MTYNVLDWLPQGSTDFADAFDEIFAYIKISGASEASVLLPTLTGSSFAWPPPSTCPTSAEPELVSLPAPVYRFTRTVRLPAGASIHVQGAAEGGVVLVLDPANPSDQYIFETDPQGAGRVMFTNLVFDGGGIALRHAPGPNDWAVLQGCRFQDIKRGVALYGVGEGARRVRLTRCTFEECFVALSLSAPASGWRIRRCRFRDNSIDVLANTHDVQLLDCTFDKPNLPSELAAPFVLLRGGGPGIRVIGCTFDAASGAPTDALVLGSVLAPSTVNDTIDVQVRGCTFNAAPEAAGSEPMHSVVRLAGPARGLVLRDCTVTGRVESMVEEDAYSQAIWGRTRWYLSSRQQITGGNAQNRLLGLAALGELGQLFSQGGRGFDVPDERTRARFTLRSTRRNRETVNLLSQPELPELWTPEPGTDRRRCPTARVAWRGASRPEQLRAGVCATAGTDAQRGRGGLAPKRAGTGHAQYAAAG